MLATRISSALANRTVLLVIFVATIVVTALIIQTAIMSSELTSKSQTIDTQQQEIAGYLTTIETQDQEIEDKIVQLSQLNAEIAAKSQEVDNLGNDLTAKGDELAALQLQADRLEAEISLLQSKIRLDEQYIAAISRQLEFTEQSAKRVKISHYSLAVMNNERGIVFPIEVEIINSGTGTVSVDVNNAQYEEAFQTAVRTAAAVASEYTGEPISDKDIIVRIIADRSELATVDGSSAGALIAGMIVAGLMDRDVSDKVLVTGTINPNGTVGRVGSIDEKTAAALDFGANVLLVPEAQEFDSDRLVVIGVLDIEEVVKFLVV